MIKSGWIACFSQTGSEILDISNTIGRFPDVLVTNNEFKNISKILLDIYINADDKTLISVPKKPSPNVYDNIFTNYIKKPTITLHGWLRIIPAEICNKFEIYNGHPGLITEFPELKGKDPVEKVYTNIWNYDKIGSVIHRVTEGVDEGEVILTQEAPVGTICRYDELDVLQRSLSKKNWIEFLKNI
jgi:folate-dependent phosphoribosylglycinamide formyltransferase PurN